MKKYSKQRELILNTVLENPIHPTADEVYHMLKKDNPNLSLGTVYRNLNLLAEHGEILKLKMEDGPDRFDGHTHEHFHMKCTSCGQVVDLEISELNEVLEKAVSRVSGHKIVSCKVAFEGICKECLDHIH